MAAFSPFHCRILLGWEHHFVTKQSTVHVFMAFKLVSSKHSKFIICACETRGVHSEIRPDTSGSAFSSFYPDHPRMRPVLPTLCFQPYASNPMLPTLCFQPDASNPTRWWQLAVREHPSRTLGRVNDQSFLIMPMPSLHLMRWLFGVVDAHQVAICSVFCKSVFCSIVLYLCRMFCCIL